MEQCNLEDLEKNALDAATKAYKSLSSNFNNDVPSFNFTMQKVSSNSDKLGGGRNNNYHHFQVNEKKVNKLTTASRCGTFDSWEVI